MDRAFGMRLLMKSQPPPIDMTPKCATIVLYNADMYFAPHLIRIRQR